MSDTIWQALADAYIRGAQGVHDDHAKLIDWKAEAAPIATEYRNQIMQELIEKADEQSARVISVWLRSQMEGENDDPTR